jgi:SAM-dependent methyltransferase
MHALYTAARRINVDPGKTRPHPSSRKSSEKTRETKGNCGKVVRTDDFSLFRSWVHVVVCEVLLAKMLPRSTPLLACGLAWLATCSAACQDDACCSELRDEVQKLRAENARLQLENLQGRALQEKHTKVTGWAGALAGPLAANLSQPKWFSRVRNQIDTVLGNDGRLMHQPFASPFAALWWRLTRVLFAAKVLPIDAAGGRHRSHRYTIVRRYVDNFMASSAVQQAASGAVHCAEIGDKHFLNKFLPFPGACQHKYGIDIKDPKADVLMDLMAPNWSLPGVTKGKYNVIVINEVMEHIQQPEKALETISQLLAPGGLLLMTTPFLVAYHANPDDHNRYTPSCVRAMLERVGMTVEHLKAEGNWLAMTGFAAGFGSDEINHDQLDAPDWLEHQSRPYQVTVTAIGRKPK